MPGSKSRWLQFYIQSSGKSSLRRWHLREDLKEGKEQTMQISEQEGYCRQREKLIQISWGGNLYDLLKEKQKDESMEGTKGREVEDEVQRMSEGPDHQRSFVNISDLGFCSEWGAEQLEGFEQKNRMLQLSFLKDHAMMRQKWGKDRSR